MLVCHSEYDVLVPIYNAYPQVQKCVDSLLRHTDSKHRIFLLDDLSSDSRVIEFLKRVAESNSNVSVSTSASRLGFVRNINHGFSLSHRDVVILNSDTEVTPLWLERMDRCRHSAPNIGIVSPLSNNATILSVPEMNRVNEIPRGMGTDDFAELVAESSQRLYPRIPSAVGFCMLITRGTLLRVGVFDLAFGLGYGEECDFCQRAWKAGVESVCCDDAFVYHEGGASFSQIEGIAEKRIRNQVALELLWPEFTDHVQEYCLKNPLNELQSLLRKRTHHQRNSRRPHLLHVIHSFKPRGGIQIQTREIVSKSSKFFRSTVLVPRSAQLVTWNFGQSRKGKKKEEVFEVLRDRQCDEPTILEHPVALFSPIIEEAFRKHFTAGDFDLVHFHHLGGWASFRLPCIAKECGKKVVISLGDYFFLCADYKMLSPQMRPCGKLMANSDDPDCPTCLRGKLFSHDPQIQNFDLVSWLDERNRSVRQMIEHSDALIAVSPYVKRLFEKAIPDLPQQKVHVILPQTLVKRKSRYRVPESLPLRVAFIGNFNERKGALVFAEVANKMPTDSFQFEVIGAIDESLRDLIITNKIACRGGYRFNDLEEKLEGIAVAVVPSIWHETYCTTVDEIIELGIPLITTDVGAVSDRIQDRKNGFLIPPNEPTALEKILFMIGRQPGLLNVVAENLSIATNAREKSCARQHLDLYHSLLTENSRHDSCH